LSASGLHRLSASASFAVRPARSSIAGSRPGITTRLTVAIDVVDHDAAVAVEAGVVVQFDPSPVNRAAGVPMRHGAELLGLH
jgi:hypothetical protein